MYMALWLWLNNGYFPLLPFPLRSSVKAKRKARFDKEKKCTYISHLLNSQAGSMLNLLRSVIASGLCFPSELRGPLWGNPAKPILVPPSLSWKAIQPAPVDSCPFSQTSQRGLLSQPLQTLQTSSCLLRESQLCAEPLQSRDPTQLPADRQKKGRQTAGKMIIKWRKSGGNNFQQWQCKP